MTKKKLLKALAIAAVTTSLVACSGGNTNSNDDSATVANSTASSGATTDAAKPDTSLDAKTVKSNASYTIGYGMGSSVSQDPNLKDYGLNNDKIVQGFQDAVNAKDPAISQEDVDNNMKQLRDTMMKQMSVKRVSSFLKVKTSIYDSSLTPKSDVKNPSVVIYEFFDYQCMYCSKVAPELEKIMENNKNVQVVFGEFPIFGERAPASEYAAEVGTAIYKLYGSDAYVKYHNGIFATGEDEGKLKNSTIDKVAEESGAKIADVKKAIKEDKIPEHVKATLETGFKDLDIQGTPFLIVSPAQGANTDNTTVIGGYADAKTIQEAVDKAQKADEEETSTTEASGSTQEATTQLATDTNVPTSTDQAQAKPAEA